jgi:hypothetical protein
MRLLITLCLTAAMVWAADNRPSDEKAVRTALDQFNEAARQGNETALNKLLGGDLIYGHSNARIETKAEAVAALVKSKPNFVVEPGATVQVYGKTAVVHGKMVANNMQNGQATKVPLDFVMVWVNQGSNWQMVTRHTTRLPQ